MGTPKGMPFAELKRQAREREQRAVEMKLAGATIEQIADALGCHWWTAWRRLHAGMEARGMKLRRVAVPVVDAGGEGDAA